MTAGDRQRTDEAEIVAIIHSIFKAFSDGDADAMNATMDPQGTVWDVFQPRLFRGLAERRQFQKEDIAQSKARGKLAIEIEDPVLDAWGDFAVARYYLRFQYYPPNAASGHVRITDVFRRDDGRWLRVHHHEGMVPSGIPPLDEPPSAA